MADLTFEMNARQEQTMTLSPLLLETMETLTLSAEELKEKIKKEAESNPTLIVKDRDASFNALAENYREKTDKSESYSDSQYGDETDDKANYIERLSSEKESLYDHLLSELGLLDLDDNVRVAAETIITALDRNGFTGENPEELLSEKERPYFDEAIKAVESLEPTGVGAKDWKDSLMLQLKATGAKEDELKLFHKLIYSELENIKAGKIEQVAKDLRTDIEDARSMVALLKTLTPFPGLKYSSDYEQYVTPELAIKKNEEGKLTLTLIKDALPIVEIDPSYEEMTKELKGSNKKDNKDAEKYLKSELQSSKDLINQLKIRETTLEKLGCALEVAQKDFFLYGPLFLKGLTMRQIAEEVGVHEATISRLANSKYIDTDWGVWPIRSLFSSSLQSEDGELSKNAVKERIRQIIENNDSGKALSDQKIADILIREGIRIARRTVGKYRGELKIDSSFERTK